MKVSLPRVRLPKVPGVVRNVTIAIVMLLLFFVVGGAAYTYYLGPDQSQQAVAPPPAPRDTTKPLIKPTKPAPDAKVGASVQMLTSPVAPGENTSITVRTLAGAKCTISVVYDKTPSADDGLKPKVADEYGAVSWTWTVEENAPLGTWPVNVTCANAVNSGMVRGDLVVAKPEQP